MTYAEAREKLKELAGRRYFRLGELHHPDGDIRYEMSMNVYGDEFVISDWGHENWEDCFNNLCKKVEGVDPREQKIATLKAELAKLEGEAA